MERLFRVLQVFCPRPVFPHPVQQAKDRRHKDERGHCGAEQSANHCAAEGRILLAAVTEAESHRNHADDHGQRRHADRTEARGAGFDGCKDGVAVFGQAQLGK